MTTHSSLPLAYRRAKRRLLLLDYDGTLVGFSPTPSEAKPPADVLNLLRALAKDDRNTVLVISGRDQKTLDNWLGGLGLHLVAEHGYSTREFGKEWKTAVDISDSWKDQIKPVMSASVLAVPGSFVEEKASALVWHYRNSKEQSSAVNEARQLTSKLRSFSRHGLSIIPGNKIVEARPRGINKGQAAAEWVSRGRWDFVLAAGDDTTDEDMFAVMPENAFTIKIGKGRTKARLRIASRVEFLDLLASLAV